MTAEALAAAVSRVRLPSSKGASRCDDGIAAAACIHLVGAGARCTGEGTSGPGTCSDGSNGRVMFTFGTRCSGEVTSGEVTSGPGTCSDGRAMSTVGTRRSWRVTLEVAFVERALSLAISVSTMDAPFRMRAASSSRLRDVMSPNVCCLTRWRDGIKMRAASGWHRWDAALVKSLTLLLF